MNQLLMMHMKNLYNSSKLPAGYIECDYIENTSNAYIDTGVIPNQNTRAHCKMYGVRDIGTWQSIFGCRGDNLKNNFSVFFHPSSKFTVFTGSGSNIGATPKIEYVGMHDISLANGKCIVDKSSATYSDYNITTNYQIRIFADDEHGTLSWPSYLRLYKFELQNGDQLLRDYIPCLEKSSGLYGLYDKVEKKFYTSPNGVKFIGK